MNAREVIAGWIHPPYATPKVWEGADELLARLAEAGYSVVKLKLVTWEDASAIDPEPFYRILEDQE